jgi:PAS domain S-box-containing protein
MLGESEALLRVSDGNDSQQLLHDPQLHGIELEIQNRDLIKAQQELENARDQYAKLYDFAPVGYLSLSRDGVIKNLNLTAASIFGKERTRLIDKPLGLVMATGMSRVLLDHLRQPLSSEQKISCDFTLKPVKGYLSRYVRSDSSVHIGADDKKYCLMTLTDVSEQRRAEQAVQDERTFLQHVIDGIDDPITVISLDYQVLRMNYAALHIARLQGLDSNNICCYQLAHQSDQPCTSEDHPCPLQRVLQTRIPCKVVHNHISETGIMRRHKRAIHPVA